MENRKKVKRSKVKRSKVKRSKVKRSKVKRSKVKRSKVKRSKVKRSKVKRSQKRKMKGGIDVTGNIFSRPCRLLVQGKKSSEVIKYGWLGDFSYLWRYIIFDSIPGTERLCHVKSVTPVIQRVTGISIGDYLLEVNIKDGSGTRINVEGLDDTTDFTIEDIKHMIKKGLKKVNTRSAANVVLVFGKNFLPGGDCSEILRKRQAALELLKLFEVGKSVRLKDYTNTGVLDDTVGNIIGKGRAGDGVRVVEFPNIELTRDIDDLTPVES